MATFITRLAGSGSGVRLAVADGAVLPAAAGGRDRAAVHRVHLAGLPALALPVPTVHEPPASLQLISGPDAEALLLATGAIIEAAV